MDKHLQILEFPQIIKQLKELSLTEEAGIRIEGLRPLLSEKDLKAALRDTTEARNMIDTFGAPPVPGLHGIRRLIEGSKKGDMLMPENLEQISMMLASVRRLKDYLARGKEKQWGIAYQSDVLDDAGILRDEINRVIRGGRIDDYATPELSKIRREKIILGERIKTKAEGLLKTHKECFSESFVVTRSGHICLPVKKEYKFKISGAVIDRSATGSTFFIEPAAIGRLAEELQLCQIAEDNEERKILYTLTDQVAEQAHILTADIDMIAAIDFIFAKGKLSVRMAAKAPAINTSRRILIRSGRHPLLDEESCIPLNFAMNQETGIRGVIVTGPNTGGKTVSIKTIGLLNTMAQCGLHVPCEEADFCMNSQVLCDIGDGQNITENLSTFSAHITNILEILKKANRESLVILDELGSGTDPAEGMGIAIAILEQLKISGCLFVATTHYPEIKAYAEKEPGIINARMAFDQETLKPLYQMEIGKAGESCALHIARRLGMPGDMIERARQAAYGLPPSVAAAAITANTPKPAASTSNTAPPDNKTLKKEYTPGIQKASPPKPAATISEKFRLGDCVMVYPDKKLGIVAKKCNEKGEVLVQLQKEKRKINQKRLKLHVAAAELYPEDYDFSIIFDTVENRKARHKMEKRHHQGLEITIEE